MAIKSTIHKLELQLSDIGRHLYGEFPLTLAQHPSETLDRMMVRALAFAWDAHEDLQFGKGVSNAEEPDLWKKNLVGEIEQWIDIGQPDADRIRRACNKADQATVYDFHASHPIWWKSIQNQVTRFSNLQVWALPTESIQALGLWGQRTMKIQCTIDHDDMWLTQDGQELHIRRVLLSQA